MIENIPELKSHGSPCEVDVDKAFLKKIEAF